MKSIWTYRLRYLGLTLVGGTALVFNGCGLSDQQLASVWQSVITSALNAVVEGALTTAVAG